VGAEPRRGRGAVAWFAGELVAEVGQGAGEQAGDVHLGDAQALADLGLGQVAVEPQVQDPLLAFGQVLQVGADGFHVDGVLDGLVVLAQHLSERRRVLGIRERRVERGGAEGQPGLAGLADVVFGDAQQVGEFAVGGGVAVLLGQVGAGGADFQEQFLERAADVDLPCPGRTTNDSLLQA
jgi:hypothetical protein